MTLAHAWAVDDLPPAGYPQHDKIAAVWGALTPIGRVQFRDELDTAEDVESVVAAWYATMRVVTDPLYGETIDHLNGRETVPLIAPDDLRAEMAQGLDGF